MALRDDRHRRIVLGERTERQSLHAVQIRLVEQLHPTGRRHIALVRHEELLGPAERTAHGLAAAHGRLRPGLDGVQHRLGARQHHVPGTGLGELHQVQRVVGTAQVDHLTGRPGERLARARAVAALACRMGGDDEVLLGGGFEADVVGHPSGEYGEVGGNTPEPALQMVGVAVGEHATHLVELAHDRLALESATPGGVPGAEHLDGPFECFDLLRPDGCGLVPVEAGRVRVEGIVDPWSVGRQHGVGVQPVVHGAGDGRSCGERGARAHQAASVEHEVHSREFGEDRCRPFGRPRQTVGIVFRPDLFPLPHTPAPAEPEVLDGHDTTESLGEQGCQHFGHGIAGGLPHVDPAPHARGVGGQLRVAHGRRLPVHHSREFALGPAGKAEQIRQTGVGFSGHVKPPGSRLS